MVLIKGLDLNTQAALSPHKPTNALITTLTELDYLEIKSHIKSSLRVKADSKHLLFHFSFHHFLQLNTNRSINQSVTGKIAVCMTSSQVLQ